MNYIVSTFIDKNQNSMYLSRIIGITLLPLILTYCTNKETKEALASAESLMWVKPDSALTIMESIDTLRINGRASKALYSLLYSMALDRNHVVVTDSRIITQAVKYYERHGSPDDRFKSLCYLGRIQNAANEYDKAVVTFSKALEHADKVKNRKFVGFVYSDIALSYTNTYNYSECNDCYDKAIVCFKESGDDDFVRMMEVNKAKNYVSMMDYHAADSLFRKIINDESFPLYYRAYSMAAYGLLLSFGQLADEKKALGLFEEAIRLSGNQNILSLNQECAYAYLLDFDGFISCYPMGQRLSMTFGEKYKAFAITNLRGETAALYPDNDYQFGFRVDKFPLDFPESDSVEFIMQEFGGKECCLLMNRSTELKNCNKIRFDSMCLKTEIEEAFDGIFLIEKSTVSEVVD